MIVLPPDVLALLDDGRISIRGMIRFDFGTGTYGFIKATTPFVYAGLTYVPGGAIAVSDLTGTTGRTAQPFTITLAASGEDALTPEVLTTIEAEDYRDRRVTVYDAFFHPDTGALLHVQAMKRGFIDTIVHEDNGDTGYIIRANCESRSLDYTRTNARRRTTEDQKRRSPSVEDRFFEHCGKRGREKVNWGQEQSFALPTSVAAPRGFKAGVTNV